METLSFTLGVLSVIIVAFVVVLVWGIDKVVKQQKQINSLEKDMQREVEHTCRLINESIQSLWNRLSEMDRDTYEHQKEFQRELDQKFQNTHREMDERFGSVYSTMDVGRTAVVEQSKSYTDSRIDKLIDTYFEIKELNKKQVIKG